MNFLLTFSNSSWRTNLLLTSAITYLFTYLLILAVKSNVTSFCGCYSDCL